MSIPYHTHDCNGCQYLGSFSVTCGDETKNYDAYSCGSHKDTDIICRFGSDGPEYVSCPEQNARENFLSRDHWVGAIRLLDAFRADVDQRVIRDAAAMLEELYRSTGVVCNLYGGLQDMAESLRKIAKKMATVSTEKSR